MKKLLRIPLLLAALFLTSIPLSAHDFEVDGIYYNILDETAKTVEVRYSGNSIFSVENEYTGDVSIPNSVTYSGTSYSVTSIGNGAFSGCTGLTSVTIPNSVTSIGESAFKGCNSLTEVRISDIAAWCNINFGLEKDYWSSTVYCESNPLYYAKKLILNGTEITDLVIPDSVTSISRNAFINCNSITSVTIPNSITAIGSMAFKGCEGLTEVRISDLTAWCNIDFEYYYGFSNNPLSYAKKLILNGSEITDLVIPDTVTTIKKIAFNNCNNITSVTIPNSVTSIEAGAFLGCDNLTEVRISDLSAWCNIFFQWGYDLDKSCSFFGNIYSVSANPLTITKKLVLNGTEVKGNISIPEGTTRIGSCAFYGLDNITSITIPNSVTSIDRSAFYECKGLSSITIPNSVEIIDTYSFGYCTGLTSITIPNSVTSIGSCAFRGCTGLSSVTLSNSINGISDGTFYQCTGLTHISIPSSVTGIWEYAFAGCSNLTHVTIPSSVTNIDDTAFKGTPFYNNMPQQGLIYLGNILYEYRGTMPDNTSIVIADGTVAIANEVFKNCLGLVSVTIPASMKRIGSEAFKGCTNLRELNLGASINIFDYYDLQGGKINLDRVNILNTISSLSISCLPPATETNIEDSTVPLEIPYASYSGNYLNCEKLRIGRDITFSNDIFKCIKDLTIGKDVNSLNLHKEYYYTADSLANLYIEPSTNKLDLTLPSGCPIDTAYIGRPLTNTFVGLRTLKHVTVEDGVDLLSGMFAGCDSIQYMALPFAGAGTAQTVGNFGELFGTTKNSNMRAVTQLMESGTSKTYYLPTGLKELVIGEGCEQLPYGALYNCSMIEKLTLPTTIKGVKENALYGCDGLTDIYVKRALPPSAYETSFTGVNQFGCTLHVPHNSKQYYSIATGWKYFYFIEEEAPLTVSVTKSIENAGEILGINQYQPGATAELEAIAHSGYTFVGWYEDEQLLTTDAKYSFTVTESHTLVAQFASLLNENDVTVTPQSEAVTLSWEQEDGAQSYGIELFSDADMTQPAGTMEVDQNGQVMTRSATSVSTTVTGLTSSMSYYYRITAYGDNRAVLSQYTGSFSTTAGVDAVNADDSLVSYSVMPGMLVVNGEGDTPVMVADMNGRVLFSGYAAGQLELPLDAGIYILRLGNCAYKVAIR